jgi:hypothetical protein
MKRPLPDKGKGAFMIIGLGIAVAVLVLLLVFVFYVFGCEIGEHEALKSRHEAFRLRAVDWCKRALVAERRASEAERVNDDEALLNLDLYEYLDRVMCRLERSKAFRRLLDPSAPDDGFEVVERPTVASTPATEAWQKADEAAGEAVAS